MLRPLLASAVAFLCLASYPVCGLKCYSCSSTMSFEDCESKVQEIQCTNEQTCGKASYSYQGKNIFQKRCVASSDCEDTAFCKTLLAKDCTVSCCDEDLCNEGPAVAVSGILVLCAAVAVMLLLKH